MTASNVQEGTLNHMHAAVLRYRVMAYITGVLIIVVCFVGIPMQIAAHNAFIVNDIGTVHGFLYIVYIIFAYILAQKLNLPTKHTVILLLAGHDSGDDVLRRAVDDAHVHHPGPRRRDAASGAASSPSGR